MGFAEGRRFLGNHFAQYALLGPFDIVQNGRMLYRKSCVELQYSTLWLKPSSSTSNLRAIPNPETTAQSSSTPPRRRRGGLAGRAPSTTSRQGTQNSSSHVHGCLDFDVLTYVCPLPVPFRQLLILPRQQRVIIDQNRRTHGAISNEHSLLYAPSRYHRVAGPQTQLQGVERSSPRPASSLRRRGRARRHRPAPRCRVAGQTVFRARIAATRGTYDIYVTKNIEEWFGTFFGLWFARNPRLSFPCLVNVLRRHTLVCPVVAFAGSYM